MRLGRFWLMRWKGRTEAPLAAGVEIRLDRSPFSRELVLRQTSTRPPQSSLAFPRIFYLSVRLSLRCSLPHKLPAASPLLEGFLHSSFVPLHGFPLENGVGRRVAAVTERESLGLPSVVSQPMSDKVLDNLRLDGNKLPLHSVS